MKALSTTVDSLLGVYDMNDSDRAIEMNSAKNVPARTCTWRDATTMELQSLTSRIADS